MALDVLAPCFTIHIQIVWNKRNWVTNSIWLESGR